MLRKTKGITLIALVITIIVLLILAGVALATLTGQGNIIENAENSVAQYNNSVTDEQKLLNEIEKQLIKHTNGENNSPKVNEDGLATENVIIKPEETSNIQIVIPKGFAPAILNGSNSTYSLPGQDGSVKEIMPAEEWNNITTEQINQGIVIVDNAITYDNGQSTGSIPDFNEYVWVSIPNFENDFKQNGWDMDSIVVNPESDEEKLNKYWDDSTTKEYQDMLYSVQQYKGFYIGRYEASDNGTGIAQSKRNQSPWTYISRTETIEACRNNTIDNMHLLYGIEWDSTLNWLIGKAKISSSTAGEIKTMELEDIKTNSCSWGNYLDSVGNAKTEPWKEDSIQNTGASEYWKANNIYDLAGNIREWTQETCNIDYIHFWRGGSMDKYYGQSCSAASRNSNASGWDYDYGFRSSFFIKVSD